MEFRLLRVATMHFLVWKILYAALVCQLSLGCVDYYLSSWIWHFLTVPFLESGLSVREDHFLGLWCYFPCFGVGPSKFGTLRPSMDSFVNHFLFLRNTLHNVPYASPAYAVDRFYDSWTGMATCLTSLYFLARLCYFSSTSHEWEGETFQMILIIYILYLISSLKCCIEIPRIETSQMISIECRHSLQVFSKGLMCKRLVHSVMARYQEILVQGNALPSELVSECFPWM